MQSNGDPFLHRNPLPHAHDHPHKLIDVEPDKQWLIIEQPILFIESVTDWFFNRLPLSE